MTVDTPDRVSRCPARVALIPWAALGEQKHPVTLACRVQVPLGTRKFPTFILIFMVVQRGVESLHLSVDNIGVEAENRAVDCPPSSGLFGPNSRITRRPAHTLESPVGISSGELTLVPTCAALPGDMAPGPLRVGFAVWRGAAFARGGQFGASRPCRWSLRRGINQVDLSRQGPLPPL